MFSIRIYLMVRSKEVEYRSKINTYRPHNGGFDPLIRKGNFGRLPHLPTVQERVSA